MKRNIAILLVLVISLTALGQTYIQDGDLFFEKGDYTSAINAYEIASNEEIGKNRQIAEIKLSRAIWCAEHISAADKAFSSKYYATAKSEYEKVLDSNPKDIYAKLQIEKCNNVLNPPKLRKATNADLTDIWNLKYGVPPDRRQNLIKAGIDADDAEKRILAGEAKPQEMEEKASYISLSKTTIYFGSEGGTSESIIVKTDGDGYTIPLLYVPSWWYIDRYNTYFKVTVIPNPTGINREDWFKITSGDKEVKINIVQYGIENNNQETNINKVKPTGTSKTKCFNCPKTNYNDGFTIGYSTQSIDNTPRDIIQIGYKVEPLFKYGFGINTGFNVLRFSTNIFNNGFEGYGFNIPLHLEYRLNFSKWFNLYSFGGIGFSAIGNSNFENYAVPILMEYGGGFRINHIQFSILINSNLVSLGNLESMNTFLEPFKNPLFSISYMY